MEDNQIVDLYWERDERAISESDAKYGAFCARIAMNILDNAQDAEECVNDTYLRAWNAIPPNRPTKLGAFPPRPEIIIDVCSAHVYFLYPRVLRGCGRCFLICANGCVFVDAKMHKKAPFTSNGLFRTASSWGIIIDFLPPAHKVHQYCTPVCHP